MRGPRNLGKSVPAEVVLMVTEVSVEACWVELRPTRQGPRLREKPLQTW